jgi:hypothetical protein
MQAEILVAAVVERQEERQLATVLIQAAQAHPVSLSSKNFID